MRFWSPLVWLLSGFRDHLLESRHPSVRAALWCRPCPPHSSVSPRLLFSHWIIQGWTKHQVLKEKSPSDFPDIITTILKEPAQAFPLQFISLGSWFRVAPMRRTWKYKQTEIFFYNTRESAYNYQWDYLFLRVSLNYSWITTHHNCRTQNEILNSNFNLWQY